MDPLLSIQIYNDPPVYRPGDVMRFDLQIAGIDLEDLSAVETSVLWTTEGKGDEDLGIHFFQRHIPSDAEGDVRSLKACNITLPNSPLSYDGGLLQVRWTVRVRIFIKGGREFCTEKPFILSTKATTTSARVVLHES